MDKIIGVIGGVPSLQKNKDDSLTDRLSHKFTVGLLILFSVIVSARQYVGDPINCWVPAHFSGAWEEYANSYCWIKNTYYLPFQNYIPAEHEYGKRETITYYQWVPLILLVQALVFYIPCMVWKSFNARSGVNIDNIVDTCQAFQLLEKMENKNKLLDQMTKQMYRFADSQHEYKGSVTVSLKNCLSKLCCNMCGRRRGNYLCVLYLFVKLLYIANIFAQFFLLNEFLGTKYHEYGIKFFQMLAFNGNEDVMEVPAFPRVTMCDFKIRVLGNVQRYTVQCVLPINLFNEMIYLFLWWWMVFIAFASIFSFFTWFIKIVIPKDRMRFIKKHLMLLNRIFPRDGEQQTYETEYLTVEFYECSEELMRKPSSDSYGADSKPTETDKYARLKERIIEKNGRMTIRFNPEKDRQLMHEILQVAPEDGRRLFRVYGDKGHAVCEAFMGCLHMDGAFVLRIVGNNTNSITITEVVCSLWDRYCERYFGKFS